MGEGISGGRLSEAEERRVSVLTCQEAKIADAITVTSYLDNKNGEERDREFHFSWVASDCKEIRFQICPRQKSENEMEDE
jgi:hypothetical protein